MQSQQNNHQEDFQYFVIYDTKTNHYHNPAPAINQFDAMRQLESLMKDPKEASNHIVSNAEDFQLFKVGSYDRKSGIIKAHQPEHVVNLHEIKAAVLNKAQPVQRDAMEINQQRALHST